MDERAPSGDLRHLSDDELLKSVQARDTRRSMAMEDLFRRYHGKVHRWCLKILKDAMEAEDVTQSIFLDLWEKPRPYRGERRFAAWLYVLTRNRCLNALRSARRRREARPEDGEWDEEIGDLLTAHSNPHEELERVEIEARVREVCQRRLEPVEQNVIALRYTWGLKVGEITEKLQLTNKSGARTHLRSAEAKLRRYLTTLRRETKEP